MSRTDKDRPWWVQNFQDGPELYDHDHRNGECIEETLELAQYFAGGGRGAQYSGKHYSKCAKRVTVEYNCTKENPHRRSWYNWTKRNSLSRQTCWTWRCACPIPSTWRDEPHACDNLRRVACIGHSRIEFQRDVPCVCDTWPARPTCARVAVDDKNGTRRWRYTWGGVPSEFVRTHYHKPERARERKLRDFAREYNAYGELEDGDFENRQARGSIRWIYW